MRYLRDSLGLLGFRRRALRSLAARGALLPGLAWLTAGFLIFVLVRNSVYSDLEEPIPGIVNPGLLDSLFQLNLVQAILFFALVYVPAIIGLGNAFAADGLGLTVSRNEYYSHVSVLFPLWGLLFTVAAPIQVLAPEFLVVGIFFGISIGLFTLILMIVVYTIWAIKELDFIPYPAAAGVFVVSWLTLPAFYVLIRFLFALPLILLIPIGYLGVQAIRSFLGSREREREFRRHLYSLTMNAQDADAHRQLGLLYLTRGNTQAAQQHFENARKIDPRDPEYAYLLGRVFEAKGDWEQALEQYEETYRLNPEFGLGDIFREVGKGYLHTGNVDKAVEFLRFFLEKRGSDPEGRYWLACALDATGATEEKRVQLNTILEQARSNPRFFRREKREWINRARQQLRQ
jgi:tetratricopeptide (TPR) repeat protein